MPVLLLVALQLHFLLRHVPWGAAKAFVALLAAVALGAHVVGVIRTVRLVASGSTVEARRSVVVVGATGLFLVYLALSLPEVVAHIAR